MVVAIISDIHDDPTALAAFAVYETDTDRAERREV